MIGILLAAGRGTRMKSEKPKVLFVVNDEPIVFAPYKVLFELCDKVVVVVGYRGAQVKDELTLWGVKKYGKSFHEKTLFFTQEPPKGTGDAVKIAASGLGKSLGDQDRVLILNGDLPLIRRSTADYFIKTAERDKVEAACLSYRTRNNKDLGRILRDDKGMFTGIREEKDANADEKKIVEVNSGVYYFKASVLKEGLKNLKSTNQQNEFYVTDLLGNKDHEAVKSEAVNLRFPYDLLGVNTTFELSQVRKIAQARLIKFWCEEKGVDFLDPETTYLSTLVEFKGAATIGPNTVLRGETVIEEGVQIEGDSLIDSSRLKKGARILWSSVIEASVVGENSQVGPMAHLRPGSELGKDVKIGNFVELKKTRMDRGSKASHLAYLGDAEVGEDSNIGCGTITCNYDGFNKYKTVVGKRTFIGSDTQLIAPVTIGDEAYIGSGSTVTTDIPGGSLAISRPELIIKADYAKKMAEKKKKQNER